MTREDLQRLRLGDMLQYDSTHSNSDHHTHQLAIVTRTKNYFGPGFEIMWMCADHKTWVLQHMMTPDEILEKFHVVWQSQ